MKISQNQIFNLYNLAVHVSCLSEYENFTEDYKDNVKKLLLEISSQQSTDLMEIK